MRVEPSFLLYPVGSAGRQSSANREILAKLDFNIFKNVAHRTAATIFSEHCLRTLAAGASPSP